MAEGGPRLDIVEKDFFEEESENYDFGSDELDSVIVVTNHHSVLVKVIDMADDGRILFSEEKDTGVKLIDMADGRILFSEEKDTGENTYQYDELNDAILTKAHPFVKVIDMADDGRILFSEEKDTGENTYQFDELNDAILTKAHPFAKVIDMADDGRILFSEEKDTWEYTYEFVELDDEIPKENDNNKFPSWIMTCYEAVLDPWRLLSICSSMVFEIIRFIQNTLSSKQMSMNLDRFQEVMIKSLMKTELLGRLRVELIF